MNKNCDNCQHNEATVEVCVRQPETHECTTREHRCDKCAEECFICDGCGKMWDQGEGKESWQGTEEPWDKITLCPECHGGKDVK